MTKEQQTYKKAMMAWIKTQENGIKSCDLAITHARQNIDMANAQIKAEGFQKLVMTNQLREAKRNMAGILK